MEQRAAGVPPEEIRPMPKPDGGGEAKEPARSNITDELLATDWSLKLGYDGTVVLVGYRDGLVITESPMETADAADGWRRAWAKALAEAGIENFRFHDLRHTAATRAQRAVGNLKTVQRMLGHKNIKTTLRYIRSDIADVRAAMEAVEKTTLSPRAVGEQQKKQEGSSA